ncbi:MAG: hypothetical protein ACI4DU_05490 [Lachnospiraceae bacterium]
MIKKRMVSIVSALLFLCALFSASLPCPIHAASKKLDRHTQFTLSTYDVTVELGGVTEIIADYNESGLAFENLAVISAKPDVVEVSLENLGAGKAKIVVQSVDVGVATIAIYSKINPTIVTYAGVNSGMAEKDSSYNRVVGTNLQVVYEDKIVQFGQTLTNEEHDVLTITAYRLTECAGRSRVTFTGTLGQNATDNSMIGFTAKFYDAGNQLIAERCIFARQTPGSDSFTISWNLPEKCVYAVFE